MKIAWIGAGVMGQAMYSHLTSSHEVHVYTRSSSKIKDTTQITVHDSIKSCVQDCDVIFTMVGYPSDVEEVYFKDNGILNSVKKDAILIDMTTSSPQLAIKIANSTNNKVLDAPVSGGDLGARNASLSIMVGGEESVYKKVSNLFELMGKNITLIGSHGAGQHCKMCNQIAVAGASAAYTEAIIYAQANNIDVQTMFTAIKSGAAGSWQIDNMAPRVLNNDLDPGFFIKHFIKDMKIAQQEMQNKTISLEMLNCVLAMYEQLADKELEDLGTQALIKYYK